MNKMNGNGKNNKVGCHCEENFSSTKQSSTPVSNQCLNYMCTIGRKVEDCRVGVSHLLAMTRIGKSLEKIFKKIFRDDASFLFAEILGSCVASPRMTEKWRCPRMTLPVLTLTTLLSFSIISDSQADTCSWSGNEQTCYDQNGNQTSYRWCPSVGSDGNCSSYSYGYDYTYDQNGNKTSMRYCDGSSNFDGDGKCSSYDEGYDYTYDQNGNQTSMRSCYGSRMGSDDNCSSYDFGYDYTYDQNGKKTGYTSVSCNTSTNICNMSVYSCNQNGSCPRTNQYTGLAYSTDGELCNSANPPVCYDFDLDASHCSINDTDESCLVCKDGYGLKNGKCQYCGSVAQSCHWDDSAGELKADSCVGGYLEKNGSCISSSKGCGDNWKDMGGWCNRMRYTPAEAAAVLNDDNTNSVTITFKK